MTEQFNEGDRVRVTNEKNDTEIITRVVKHSLGYLCINPVEQREESKWHFLSYYTDSAPERTIELIEKAKPKLPTEPGSVVKFKGDFGVWQLFKDRLWYATAITHGNGWDDESLLSVRGHDFEIYEAKK